MISRNILSVFIVSTVLFSFTTHALEKKTTFSVTFEESAPKDIFTIQNTGPCRAKDLRFQIDLSTSESGLIFDTTDAGAGVNVFQPLEIKDGYNLISSISDVNDGDQLVTFALKPLEPNAIVAFTVDIDDTLKKSERGQTMVSGAEIQGATVRLEMDKGNRREAIFSDEAQALFKNVPCV